MIDRIGPYQLSAGSAFGQFGRRLQMNARMMISSLGASSECQEQLGVRDGAHSTAGCFVLTPYQRLSRGPSPNRRLMYFVGNKGVRRKNL